MKIESKDFESSLHLKQIMSRVVIFDELSMLHSKFVKDLAKAKDVTKQVEFESFIIRNISNHKQFEAPNETNQDLQMHPQHHNLAPVEGNGQTSQNHLKQPKTTTPKKSQRQIKAPERYGFNIVPYALQ